MKDALPLFAALPLIILFGAAEGWWTNRWHTSQGAEQAAARLADIPRIVGEWEGQDQELDARQVVLAKLDGYVMRRYVRRRTGDAVSVMLVCGRPGPISAHTPDICFQGAGYEMSAAQERLELAIPGLPAPTQFWAARFDAPGVAPTESSTVLWSWSADGRWSAADRPRIEFARATELYKLYVIRPLTELDLRPANDDVLKEFLRDFLYATQAALFPPR